MFALATLKGTATALLLSQKVCEKAALSLVPLLVDAPMYSFQATARPGQRRSSAKNPLHDLLLMLQDRREVD
jgi:hypothetical protein